MSRGQSIRTIIRIIEAFRDERTWKQAELRRRIGVSMDTLRANLDAMQTSGWPLERDEDPPQVYWSLPEGSFFGGVLLSSEEAMTCLRLLQRLRPSEARTHLIDTVVRCLPAHARDLADVVHHTTPPDLEKEAIRETVEDAIARGEAVDAQYYSSHGGTFEWRRISFHRVVEGPHVRLCGVCHRADVLRWFRLDRIAACRASDEAYRVRSSEAVEKFIDSSVDGYHDGGPPVRVAFFVRSPESNWVRSNLPPPLTATRVDGGIRVEGEVSGRLRVAQFVVGLGAAARPLDAGLAETVQQLAWGALANAQAAMESAAADR